MIEIQSEIRELVIYFRNKLESILKEKFYGLYLYNSAARGEFELISSDIDFIVLIKETFNDQELQCIADLHKELITVYDFGNRLDGMYLLLTDIGKTNEEIIKYPYTVDGKLFKSGYFDLNNITWWSLKTDGKAIESPDLLSRLAYVDWRSVKTTLSYNLNGYWNDKLEKYDLFLDDLWFEFGTCTISRIIFSLEHKNIISKVKACEYIAEKLPQWKDVTDEAIRIRLNIEPSQYDSLLTRRDRIIEFITKMIEYGNEILLLYW